MTRTRLALAVSLLVGCCSAAAAQAVVVSERTSTIISPPPESGPSDGASDNISFSQDNRHTRLVAFDSAATDIVPGDVNGFRDVFVQRRARPGANGNFTGTLSIASVNSSGQQANGHSSKPNLDGDRRRRPHCVVFESTATNLDQRDTTPDVDIFLRDLRTRRTELVSVGHEDARNPSIDGDCATVTYDTNGVVYVRSLELDTITRIAVGSNPDQQNDGKGVAYERRGQIYHYAFQRFHNRGRPVIKRRGREVLVSRTKRGRRGNGVSRNPVMGDFRYYVAFESTATNLCIRTCNGVSGDRNGAVSDVFRRNLDPRRAPTDDYMQMVSYSRGCSAKRPGARTVNAQGNGPSNNPSMTGAGENIVFDSEATNLRESRGILVADGNGRVRDIYYWNFPRGRKCGNVSRESRNEDQRESGTGQPYNGPSYNPAASNRANFIGFTSEQAGDSGETNGAAIPDVFARFLGGGPG